MIRSVFKRRIRWRSRPWRPSATRAICWCCARMPWPAWTMRQLEAGGAIDWESLLADVPSEQWQQWVVSLRQENQIRFDDSTVVLLRVGDEPAHRGSGGKRGGTAAIAGHRRAESSRCVPVAERLVAKGLEGPVRRVNGWTGRTGVSTCGLRIAFLLCAAIGSPAALGPAGRSVSANPDASNG